MAKQPTKQLRGLHENETAPEWREAWGALWTAPRAAPEAGQSFCTQVDGGAVCRNSLAGVATTRSSSGTRPNVVGGGTATLGRQDLGDARADRPEEVRGLRAMCGDSAAPLTSLARACLPSNDLLTLRDASFCSGNGPQLCHAAHPRRASRRRPPGAQSSSTTRRCRGECRQRAAASSSHARVAESAWARVAPVGRGGVNLGRAARAECGCRGRSGAAA